MDYNEQLKSNLLRIFHEFTEEFSLPDNSFCVKDNFSQSSINAGKLISTEIDIQEPAFPPDQLHSIAKTSLVLYMKPNPDFYEILVRHDRLPHIELPNTAQVKDVSDKLYSHILFSFDDNELYPFIAANIRYCISTYSSSSTFGCCSRYRECSASRSCLHPNKLYAIGCSYRKNLENNNIFY